MQKRINLMTNQRNPKFTCQSKATGEEPATSSPKLKASQTKTAITFKSIIKAVAFAFIFVFSSLSFVGCDGAQMRELLNITTKDGSYDAEGRLLLNPVSLKFLEAQEITTTVTDPITGEKTEVTTLVTDDTTGSIVFEDEPYAHNVTKNSNGTTASDYRFTNYQIILDGKTYYFAPNAYLQNNIKQYSGLNYNFVGYEEIYQKFGLSLYPKAPKP